MHGPADRRLARLPIDDATRAALAASGALLLAGCYLAHGAEPEAPVTFDPSAPADEGAPDPDLGRPPAPVPDAGVDQGLDEGPLEPPDVERACASPDVEDVQQVLRFEAAAGSCPWFVEDNQGPAQGQATARTEERRELDVPARSVLCDLELAFGALGSSVMRYDDNFFLLLGDVVLAASDGDLVELLPTQDGLPTWAWDRLVGRPMAVVGNQPWCLGEAEGRADCVIPATDTPGTARLDFDASLVAELAVRALERGDLGLTFVTVGDNDPGTDCSHNDLDFEASVRFRRP